MNRAIDLDSGLHAALRRNWHSFGDHTCDTPVLSEAAYLLRDCLQRSLYGAFRTSMQ